VRLALSYNKNTVASSDREQYSCFVSVSIQSFRNQIATEYYLRKFVLLPC